MSCKHGNWSPCDECDAEEAAQDAAYQRGFAAGKASVTQPEARGKQVGCGDHDHADYIPGCGKCASTLPGKHRGATPNPVRAEQRACPICAGECVHTGNWISDTFKPLPAEEVAALQAVGAPGFETPAEQPEGKGVVVWIAQCELDSLVAAQKWNAHGIVWSRPTGQAGVPLYTSAPAAPVGVDGWTLVIETGRDGETGVWAKDRDGSKIWLAALAGKGGA